MDKKAAYQAFCQRHPVPVYLQPWWWDAVCGADGWQAAVATDEGDEPIGIFPYVLKRRAG
ncbi:MAG: hypothetical protein IT269_05865, partial [Saprospiraceae bacterium]|nr:hypothetical protein [Saprospiraceae bacterium]